MQNQSAGARFKAALTAENPLQIPGTINAYSALLAEQAGFKALYLSGAGVANASFGLPDLGITTATEVLEEARRITACSTLPLLVDIDTGFGPAFSLTRIVKDLIHAGVAALHLEDQIQSKRCGHRPNKQLVSCTEMVDRIKTAVDARFDPDFLIMARSDALANEGLEKTLTRLEAYVRAGADLIFLEGATSLDDYRKASNLLKVPLLANMTEFGLTPLFSRTELKAAGVQMILYPLSAFRAMSQAAERVYQTLRKEGSQTTLLAEMQTREALYNTLNYHHYEALLDQLNNPSTEGKSLCAKNPRA